MISKAHRFHGYNSLRRVYTQGSTVRVQQIALKYILNDRRSSYRVAVVVSRKVSKSAVVRNRIRRRIYECIRLHEALITQPYDLVFSVFSEQTATDSAERLEKQIYTLLEKSDVLSHATGKPRDIVKSKE